MYLKVDTKEALIFLIQAIEEQQIPWIAIDTEFFRETTYFPILSLIQIATESEIWVIDALSCKDLAPLKALLENENIKKIFHAGEQDWAILKQVTGAITWPFYDTQIMATFAKFGHSNSLESLVSKLLETTIDKSQQKTDWLQRPLTPQQLIYAAQDAAHVAKTYLILQQKLAELGRETWVAEEMAILLEKYQSENLAKDWLKLCSTGCKWPVPFYAMKLAKWREDWAKKLNIPKRHVVADSLLETALRKMDLEHFSANNCATAVYEDLLIFWEKLGQEYLDQTSQQPDLQILVKNHHQEWSPNQRKHLKKLQSAINDIAITLEIPPHCVLNKTQLQQLACGEESVVSGWRAQFLERL